MKTSDAVTFAGGSTALALMLRITPGAISQWGEYPPDNRQLQLERITRKQLRAEPGCMDRVLGLTRNQREPGSSKRSDIKQRIALGTPQHD